MNKILKALVLFVGSAVGGFSFEAVAGLGLHGVVAQALNLTQVTIHSAITWSGASSYVNSWIWQSDPALGVSPGSNAISGTCTDTLFCTPNLFVVGRDTVDASAAANGFYAYMFTDNFGGPAAKSSHHTILGQFNYVATPGDSSFQDYTTANFWSLANAAAVAGGGDLFGVNAQCKMGSSATGWTQCVGMESDIDIDPSATVQQLIGHQVVQQTVGGATGSQFNSAYSSNNASGATGWDYLFVDGAYAGYPSLKSTGTWGGCYPHAGSGNCGTITNGIDFRLYTFNGTPFGAPLITPASSSAACVAGGLEWDASFLYVCTATNTWKRATLATF